MNGGGGHEKPVTSVLAEAESGMLIHCCCFVVNLVQRNISLRLQDAYPEQDEAQPVHPGTLSEILRIPDRDSARSRGKEYEPFWEMF